MGIYHIVIRFFKAGRKQDGLFDMISEFGIRFAVAGCKLQVAGDALREVEVLRIAECLNKSAIILPWESGKDLMLNFNIISYRLKKLIKFISHCFFVVSQNFYRVFSMFRE